MASYYVLSGVLTFQHVYIFNFTFSKTLSQTSLQFLNSLIFLLPCYEDKIYASAAYMSLSTPFTFNITLNFIKFS